jgi:hypothetical protein
MHGHPADTSVRLPSRCAASQPRTIGAPIAAFHQTVRLWGRSRGSPRCDRRNSRGERSVDRARVYLIPTELAAPEKASETRGASPKDPRPETSTRRSSYSGDRATRSRAEPSRGTFLLRASRRHGAKTCHARRDSLRRCTARRPAQRCIRRRGPRRRVRTPTDELPATACRAPSDLPPRSPMLRNAREKVKAAGFEPRPVSH